MTIRHSKKDTHLCRKGAGIHTGLVCDDCDGRCVLCDAYTNLVDPAKLCDDCALGPSASKCLVCGNARAPNEAMYCRQCVMLERDRDGCPRHFAAAARRVVAKP
jgi:PHD finger-like domain-containing protein 5A